MEDPTPFPKYGFGSILGKFIFSPFPTPQQKKTNSVGFPSGDTDSHMPRVMIPHWCHGPTSASTWELEMVVARRRREAAERCQDGGLCLWGPHVVVEVVVEPSRDTECGPHQEFRLLAWSCNYKRDLHHLKSFSHTHTTHT